MSYVCVKIFVYVAAVAVAAPADHVGIRYISRCMLYCISRCMYVLELIAFSFSNSEAIRQKHLFIIQYPWNTLLTENKNKGNGKKSNCLETKFRCLSWMSYILRIKMRNIFIFVRDNENESKILFCQSRSSLFSTTPLARCFNHLHFWRQFQSFQPQAECNHVFANVFLEETSARTFWFRGILSLAWDGDLEPTEIPYFQIIEILVVDLFVCSIIVHLYGVSISTVNVVVCLLMKNSFDI